MPIRGASAPMLSDRDLSPVSMIAALWSHGPAMQTEMSKRSLAWPQIRKSEISDMAAYLRTRHPSALRELPHGAVSSLLAAPVWAQPHPSIPR